MLITVPDKRFPILTLPVIWNLSLSIIFLVFLIQKYLWIFLGMISLEDFKEKKLTEKPISAKEVLKVVWLNLNESPSPEFFLR